MTEPDTKSIGARIQKARLSRKMTQAELAEKTGIDPVYVSQVERGHRLVLRFTPADTRRFTQNDTETLLS